MPPLSKTLHRAVLAFAVAAPLLTGCSTPLAIDADPESNGLLILDAGVRREFILDIQVRLAVADAAIADVMRVDERIRGIPHDGLIVFAVPAGEYVIQRVTTDDSFWSNWDVHNYVFRQRDLPDNLNPLAVRNGNALYVGPVVVQETSGFSGLKTTIRWTPEDGDEAERLRSLREELVDDRWKRAVDRRLSELGG